jgi:hypothetical protein
MKAITIWQPWASLIMIGAKSFEFRRWPAPRGLRGERIVIHAGTRPMRKAEIAELLNDHRRLNGSIGQAMDSASPALARAMYLLDRVWTTRHVKGFGDVLPLGMALGVATLGEPKRCTDLFPGEEDIDDKMWGWPLSDVRSFEMPVPIKGAQGFWDWPGALPALPNQEAA